jgi:hypothetical protein
VRQSANNKFEENKDFRANMTGKFNL